MYKSTVLVKTLGAALLIFSLAGQANAAKTSGDSNPVPDYPPLKNQYYPTDNKKFQDATITNPSAHTRKLVFKGTPLDIFTKIDMVTQIVLPSPPITVNIGKSEGFTVEIIDALNSIFIKPSRQVELTNLIVNCENGAVYLFILKENPFQPWDMRCEVLDPHRQIKKDDSAGIIKALYLNQRLPEMQFHTMDLRTPNSTAYVYDPLTKMGCMITLKRALAFPQFGKSGYWVEFHNTTPTGVGKGTLNMSTYAISEKTVWAKKLTKVAVPGTKYGDDYSTLNPGEKLNMFLLIDAGAIPEFLNFRFALTGARNITVDVQLPTAHLGGVDENATRLLAEKTVDERLREEYEKLVKEGKITPMTEEEIEAEYQKQQDSRETAAQEADRQAAIRENERRNAASTSATADSSSDSGISRRSSIGFPAP